MPGITRRSRRYAHAPDNLKEQTRMFAESAKCLCGLCWAYSPASVGGYCTSPEPDLPTGGLRRRRVQLFFAGTMLNRRTPSGRPSQYAGEWRHLSVDDEADPG